MPSYFGTWFGRPTAAALPTPGITGPRRDDTALGDIEARLLATGYVDLVVVGADPRESEVTADRSAVAWVKRTSWRETPGAASDLHDRTVSYSLWLSVRGHDPQERWARLCQLEAAAIRGLNRVKLGDFCMPTFTWLQAGRDDPTRDGESRVVLAGQFRYQLQNQLSDRPLDSP